MRRMLLGVVLASVAVAACGGGGERGSAATVTEYVGMVAGMDPAVPEPGKYVVAVTIAADGKVLAYACDGLGSSASLTGTAHGGRLDLRASDGGQLQATVEGSTVTGTLTVAGSAHAFTATKQEDVGGLYTLQLELSSDEHAVTVTGASERGNRLDATLTAGQAAPFPVSFTLVDGSRRTVRLGAVHSSTRLAGFDGYRLAFLDRGFGRGSPTRTSTQLVSTTPHGGSLLQVTGFIPPATRD